MLKMKRDDVIFPCSRQICVVVQQITSGPRHIAKAKRKDPDEDWMTDTQPGQKSRNELDTRADTICAGNNFRCVRFSGMVCQVHGFHKSFEVIPDIPVATVATAWDDPRTGQCYILIIHQALYFGTQLDHSLINVNQIRITGIPVCDDPFDRYRQLGIDTDETHIPFEMEGNTIYFKSRVPTQEEMSNSPYIILTDDIDWDPKNVDLSDPKPKEIGKVESVEYTALASQEETTLAYKLQGKINVQEVASKTRHSSVNPEHLARVWNIGIEKAKNTLRVTTQKGIRYAIHPIHKRYRVNHLLHLGINARQITKCIYVDHMQSKVKSLAQNTGLFLYTTGAFTKVYPVDTTAKAGETLVDFTRDIGVPTDIRTDLATYFTGRETNFVKEAKRLRIKIIYAEKGRHVQNHAAEREIRDLKRRWHAKMIAKSIPKHLWDYGVVHQAEIMSRIARGKDGRTGYEEVVGETPDISEWIDFDIYDLVWYHDPPDTMAETTGEIKKLGRWLGVANRVGSALTYWILTKSCKIIARSTVQHVTASEELDTNLAILIQDFDRAVNERLDDRTHVIKNLLGGVNILQDEDDLLDDPAYGTGKNTPTDEEYQMDQIPPDRVEEDDIEESTYDKYIGAEVTVDFGTEGQKRATVKSRATDFDGKPMGHGNKNPELDHREYVIEYEDGTYDWMFANAIAANMYSQIDDEGMSQVMLREIVDHQRSNDAIRRENGFVLTKHGKRIPKRTTQGWKLCVEWKDGTNTWVALKDLKETNPVELAEYAMVNQIHLEPAFAWWVPTVLKKRERIIKKLQKKYWRVEYKFGVRIPKSVEEALRIDYLTGTDYWEKAIRKEMSRVNIAYEVQDDIIPDDVRKGKCNTMIGFQEIKCHMIFDVKMDFTRKARFVAGGHMTQPATSMTYSSVVSRDSVRIAFLTATLNGLLILSCDVGNAYLNALCREKIWFQAGRECGADMGKVMIIKRALYGLRTSGASWRQMLSDTLLSKEFGYFQSRGDPDVYLKRRTRPNDGDYYEMILVFVDDILCISHAPQEFMDKLGKVYDLGTTVAEPTIYLGSNIIKHQLPNGTMSWAMGSETYVKNAIATVNELLREDGRELRTTQRRGRTPLPVSYKPELEQSKELDGELVSRYLQLIGILRWAVELGRIDIEYETAILSQYSASPREGHIEAVYHIFVYLTLYPSAHLVFDPTTPYIDEASFQHDVDWKPFYGTIEEEKPRDMPYPLGLPVQMTTFVDANHAGNVITRRSHTGIIIFLQNAPILWYSKKQNTVEASTFGSELVAMRVARDLIAALRIKLRLFGIPLDGPANLLCDNQGVVKNTSIPESTLTKKHNAINFHIMRISCNGHASSG